MTVDSWKKTEQQLRQEVADWRAIALQHRDSLVAHGYLTAEQLRQYLCESNPRATIVLADVYGMNPVGFILKLNNREFKLLDVIAKLISKVDEHMTISKATHETFQGAFAAAQEFKPIDMVLHCPECGVQHIDAPEETDPATWTAEKYGNWTNPPHRSHLCSACGLVWRPANVPTNGVKAIKTKGKLDDPIGPRHMETLLNGQVEDFFEGLGASDDVKAIQSAFRSIGLAEDTIKHILTVICRSKVAP